MMNETIYEYHRRAFLSNNADDLSAIYHGVTLTEQYLDVCFDVTDGEKVLYFNGFMSTEGNVTELDNFKLKIMNLRNGIDDMLYSLEKAEEKLKELNGK